MTKPDFGMWRVDGHQDEGGSDEVKQAYDIYKSYRADIIDAAIMVEHELDEVLCDCFFKHGCLIKNQFKSMVLHAEFCTFFQKWKILRSCINEKTEWFETVDFNESDKKIKELKNVISYRNMFAHGDIVVKSSDYSCSIYFSEGTRKESEINEKYINQILKEFKTVFMWLIELQRDYAVNSKKL